MQRKQRQVYTQVNLVSDIPGVALFTDPNAVNTWSLDHSPSGPWIVSDNGSSVATSYLGNGRQVPPIINIPPIGASAPTGLVFNPFADSHPDEFVISQNGISAPATFLFDTEDGFISGWNPTVDPNNAITVVDRSGVNAVYKGLAIGEANAQRFLYATNFNSGLVEVFDSNFNLVNTFTDPNLASVCPFPNQCFSPFGIRNIKGFLFVTFALQDDQHHDNVDGPGLGYVDVFDTSGNLIKRLISQGPLNAPFGLARAPKCFGKFSKALLVGNFGDGLINAFDIKTGEFLGSLENQVGNPIQISGLWGISFGNGKQAGPKNHLFFAAGIDDENHGLFGFIKVECIDSK